MALTPKDIQATFRDCSPDEMKAADILEQLIDEHLSVNYEVGESVIYTVTQQIQKHVLRELARRYRKTGWVVMLFYDNSESRAAILFKDGLQQPNIEWPSEIG